MKSPTTFPHRTLFLHCTLAIAVSLTYAGSAFSQGADKNRLFTDAIGYMPVQRGVLIDIPTQEEMAQCEMKLLPENKGFVIYAPQGNILRMFLDTTGSGKVDQWSYYRNGVEVYRDIDSNKNGNTDQCRWFHSGGTRWGIDADEDGVIDQWRQISPEEVSSEIVLALCERDVNRFLRVALTPEQLAGLQLGEKLNAEVARKIAGLRTRFAEAVKAVALSNDVEWYQFGGNRPGVVPAGREGCAKDVTVYENGIAVIRDGADNKQIAVGSLVRVGDNNWRCIDLPQLYDETAMTTTFIPMGDGGIRETTSGERDEIIKLIGEIDELQKSIAKTEEAKRPAVYDLITRKILNIIKISTTPEDRDLWMRQLADVVMAAVQMNEYPDGPKNLEILYTNTAGGDNRELAAYIKSRLIMTRYYAEINTGGDQLKPQVAWLENLEQLVTEYDKTEAGADGMLLLGSYREMADQLPEARKWYRAALVASGQNPKLKSIADKATGALRRLDGIGKAIPFQTKDAAGNTINVAAFKGNPVLVYFWDSRSTQDIPEIKALAAKTGLKVVGVNLDPSAAAMNAVLAKTPVDWPMINEPAGLDSPVAVYWGVQTTPLMILYDKEGNLAAQNIPGVPELEKAIK